jgi:hypothetical protein
MNFKTSGASRRETTNACGSSIHVSHRHCEERLRGNNPESFHGPRIAALALAMTMMGMRASPQIAIPCFEAEKLKSN